MSAIDRLVAYNAEHPALPSPPAPAPPGLHLAVVTCMDARIDLPGALGLNLNEAHVLRNAGGVVTDDVLRSLALSQRALATREVAIIQHTQCGMSGFDDAAFRAELTAESGTAPDWDVPGFDDVAESVGRAVRTVRECPWLPHRDGVRGFVYDLGTDLITEVG